MKKILTGTVLLLTVALSAFSQTKDITVSGRIIEADTKEPAIQANVQLLQLPDSAYVTGNSSSTKGYFTLPKVAAGKYVLKVSYIGFKTLFVPLSLTSKATEKNVGTLSLETDAVLLAEAVVTAEAPQVQVVEDTLMYNSSAYRTPAGAMLEELVKKLPGAEVDDDGNVKINGKEIKKIMMNGKEFFGGDVKTGLKNLPVEMVDKLKTYDKKSDMARITGIDDGEEETVLDLTVKKGMNKGIFGNFDGAIGTKDRYSANGMVNYFADNTQLSFIGGANNVGDRGFSGGGGGPRFRQSNGLQATKTLGVTFATETEKLELGGSARYNYSDVDAVSSGDVENFLTNGSSFSKSTSRNDNTNRNFNADFRLEWKPDSMTNIIFRPNFSYSKSKSRSQSQSGTFNSDPNNLNWDWEKMKELMTVDLSDDEALSKALVNASNNQSASDGNSISANATLQLNRKLNSKGRNITFRGRFGYGDSESESYNASETRYFQSTDGVQREDDIIRRYSTTPSNNYNYSAQITYSEPIARATFLQFSYEFQYKYTESDRKTYALGDDWAIGEPLPSDYLENEEKDQSKYAEYQYYNHDARVSLRFIREKWQLSAGLSFQPQNTKLSYAKGEYMVDTTRNVFNFSPNVEFRFRFSKVSQLRLTYRGSSSQPSMENLLPITDNSDPLNIREGNQGLKPSFSHNMRFFYNTYNPDAQRGIMAHGNFSLTQNSISNLRTYNETTGGWTTKPENINGNWNASAGFGFNTALPNKKYTINTFSNVSYKNNVGYLSMGNAASQKNTTTDLSLSERLNGSYRNDWLEIGLNGNITYNIEKDKLNSQNNQKPYTFSYGGNVQVTAPWNMTLSTNIANQSRRGYSDSSMNRNEVIWNAQLSQTFLKGNATVSFEMYDILKQQSNISRMLTSSGRSVYQYNGVNSYCMLHFIYRLNIFGGKEAREKMREGRGFPGGGMRMGTPPGGFRGGGGRPF